MSLELIGYAGSAIYLLAYFMAAKGTWPAHGLTSIIFNLVGSGLLCYYSWAHSAYASMVLNLAWGAIGGFALLKVSKRAND